ncbi:hypothetical protein PtA15_5A416 [Puccinia triticina]|uniref:Uncharacterized protein n=1 Tax=Puccinia triticina TaxID=208348 RepID=A0ABY7CIU8_9BASI|nr:uncharacterized protein PtA15_5A416 [Puccinia triticina]WAQ84843.1 hypothetical protein PtA15_5A416 [Puccinia triticina]WAR58191.1 hypothetical protein PtB15_5B423 [Puccinia triticina]
MSIYPSIPNPFHTLHSMFLASFVYFSRAADHNPSPSQVTRQTYLDQATRTQARSANNPPSRPSSSDSQSTSSSDTRPAQLPASILSSSFGQPAKQDHQPGRRRGRSLHPQGQISRP